MIRKVAERMRTEKHTYKVDLPQPMPSRVIRQALKTLGLTQADLADELGIAHRTVRRWLEEEGAPAACGVAITLMLRLKAAGCAWRHNSENIDLGPHELRAISDREAVERYRKIEKIN